MNKNFKLPKKLSTWIRLAIKDLEKTEKDDRYQVNMAVVWHEPPDTYPMIIERTEVTLCIVCFAGAVMAQRGRADINSSFTPSMFGEREGYAFLALDEVMRGNLAEAFASFNQVEFLDACDMLKEKGLKSKYYVTKYKVDKTRFKSDVMQLSELLRKAGF